MIPKINGRSIDILDGARKIASLNEEKIELGSYITQHTKVDNSWIINEKMKGKTIE